MGYSTTYTITKVDGDAKAFRDAFCRHREAKENGYRWFGIQVESEPTKWYEHEAHIIYAMLESGVTAVDLHGEGEEQGDVWDKEFRWLGPESGAKVKVKKFKYSLVRDEVPS
jgi:hypothetical protein